MIKIVQTTLAFLIRRISGEIQKQQVMNDLLFLFLSLTFLYLVHQLLKVFFDLGKAALLFILLLLLVIAFSGTASPLTPATKKTVPHQRWVTAKKQVGIKHEAINVYVRFPSAPLCGMPFRQQCRANYRRTTGGDQNCFGVCFWTWEEKSTRLGKYPGVNNQSVHEDLPPSHRGAREMDPAIDPRSQKGAPTGSRSGKTDEDHPVRQWIAPEGQNFNHHHRRCLWLKNAATVIRQRRVYLASTEISEGSVVNTSVYASMIVYASSEYGFQGRGPPLKSAAHSGKYLVSSFESC